MDGINFKRLSICGPYDWASLIVGETHGFRTHYRVGPMHFNRISLRLKFLPWWDDLSLGFSKFYVILLDLTIPYVVELPFFSLSKRPKNLKNSSSSNFWNLCQKVNFCKLTWDKNKRKKSRLLQILGTWY